MTRPCLRLPLLPFALTAAALLLIAAGAPPAPPSTVITSDDYEGKSNATETTSVFTGHVDVTGNDLHMTCDRLLVISTRVGDPTDTIGQPDQFKYLLATGHVHIISGTREATCGRAEVLPRQNQVTLTEDPVVTDRSNGTVAKGEELVLLKNEQRVIIRHHVQVTLPPIRDIGFHDQGGAAKAPDETEPAPAAPPAPSAP